MNKRILLVLFLGLFLAAGCRGSDENAMTPWAPGKHRREMKHGGLSRTYRAYVPVGARDGSPIPVVFIFHGAGINGAWMMKTAGIEGLADRERFVAVFPDGARDRTPWLLKWNAEQCCGYAMERGIDDVGFAAAMIEDLARFAPLDRRRVYACGWSNGGMLSYRLACERPDLFAAVASVAGTLSVTRCLPARPVPMLHIHGTADGMVPYFGPDTELTRKIAPHQSVKQTVGAWLAVNGCAEPPIKENLPDAARDGTTVTRETWNACVGGSEVVLYTVAEGGHTWPGGRSGLEFALGRVTHDISANEVIWDFFKRHPMF